MHNAHNPLTTAIAAATGARVARSLISHWLPRMAIRPSAHPIDRGVSR